MQPRNKSDFLKIRGARRDAGLFKFCSDVMGVSLMYKTAGSNIAIRDGKVFIRKLARLFCFYLHT